MIVRKTAAELEKMRRSGLLVFCNGADCGDYSSGLSSWNRRQLRLKEALYELRLTKNGREAF